MKNENCSFVNKSGLWITKHYFCCCSTIWGFYKILLFLKSHDNQPAFVPIYRKINILLCFIYLQKTKCIVENVTYFFLITQRQLLFRFWALEYIDASIRCALNIVLISTSQGPSNRNFPS